MLLRELGINGPLASVEGVSMFVFLEIKKAFVDLSNKDGPTVYQKRSRLLIWKDLYNRWDLPSGGASKRVSTRLRPIKRRD